MELFQQLKVWAQCLLAFLRCALISTVLNFTYHFYFSMYEVLVKKIITQARDPIIKNDREDYIHTFKSSQFFATMLYNSLLDALKTAQKGKSAPNTTVISLDGKTKVHLLDFMKQGRPLVVNFGSCT